MFVLFTEHLMFVVLHPEEILLALAELGETVEDGGLAGVLEPDHANHEEVRVVREIVRDAVTEHVSLVNKLYCLSQFMLGSVAVNKTKRISC